MIYHVFYWCGSDIVERYLSYQDFCSISLALDISDIISIEEVPYDLWCLRHA